MKEKIKDPVEGLKVTINGTAGIVGGVYKLLPGYKVLVNAPDDNLNNAPYRILETHEILTTNAERGFDFVIELTLIPYQKKAETLYIGDSKNSPVEFRRALIRRVAAMEQHRVFDLDYPTGLPTAIPGKKVADDRGTAFPSNPIHLQRFYRTDLKVWFRYSTDVSSWIPASGINFGTFAGYAKDAKDSTDTSYIEHIKNLAKGESKNYDAPKKTFDYEAVTDLKYKKAKITFELSCEPAGNPTAYGRVRYRYGGSGDWTQLGAEQSTTSTSWVPKTVSGEMTVGIDFNAQLELAVELGGQNDDPLAASWVKIRKINVEYVEEQARGADIG